MRLCKQAPRCFRERLRPGYPVAAAGLLVLASGCHPGPQREPTGPVMAVPESSASAVASRPPTGPLVLVPGDGARTGAQGLADAHRAPRFAEDDSELDLDASAGCQGDCPSPFETATGRKDRAQMRVRLAWCVRSSRQRGEVPAGSVLLRATVASNGRLRELTIEPQSIALPDDVVACLRELAGTATVTPPAHAPERLLHAFVEIEELR